uniref:Uncharacterized protein n=1 Tax=Cacopsylla melanoneura TaxID=428564 RepID=A0A8D9B2V3_9HEMI
MPCLMLFISQLIFLLPVSRLIKELCLIPIVQCLVFGLVLLIFESNLVFILLIFESNLGFILSIFLPKCSQFLQVVSSVLLSSFTSSSILICTFSQVTCLVFKGFP